MLLSVSLATGHCCSILLTSGVLARQVTKIAAEKKYDYLLIESTGISEPMPVAATFVTDIEGKRKPIESEIRKDPKVESSTLNLKPSALFSISALSIDQIVRCCAVRRNASKPPLFVSVLHLRSSVLVFGP